jgi:hypothetical protein
MRVCVCVCVCGGARGGGMSDVASWNDENRRRKLFGKSIDSSGEAHQQHWEALIDASGCRACRVLGNSDTQWRPLGPQWILCR